VSMGS